MDLTISAPDHTTVSRRAVTLPAIQPASAPHGPLHVLIDSTGLQVYGAGQWLEAKHGAKSRRKWRKLHLAVDASSGMIVAQTLTDQDVDDPSQVGPLLDQIDGRIIRVTADGAYDGAPTYQTIATHGDGIDVVIPPRSTAVPSADPGPPTQRDRHLAMITERGRLAWRAATDYGQRALIETTMGRYKCAVLLANTSTCATILRRYGLLGRPLQAQPTSAWQQVETGERGGRESSMLGKGGKRRSDLAGCRHCKSCMVKPGLAQP